MDLAQKTILVLGIGESGLAMARWALHERAHCRIADSRLAPPGLDRVRAALSATPIHLGGFPPELLEGVDLIAISQGLSPLLEPQSGLLQSARQRGIPIWGEIEFFSEKLRALKAERGYASKLIAITGTNGKTTVTRLTGQLCERAGLRTCVAGNISPALLDALRSALDEAETTGLLPEVWVLELCSFQLERSVTLESTACAILNITQDHFDWHGSIQAYTEAKARILDRAQRAVLNRLDATVMSLAGRAPQPVVTFGLDPPIEPESFGVVIEGGVRWLAYAQPEESDEPVRRGKKPATVKALTKRLMPIDALRIRGDHNAANALAALALCHAIGLPLAPLLHGLRDYRGEPHRVETISTIDGIEFIDDSKGTNVGATVAALEGLGKPIVLIAGGEGKGQDFSPLAAPVARHARAVVLIGKDAPQLRQAITVAASEAGVILVDAASLEDAVHSARELARPGDAVLLSPACASLDMFRNYAHRAQVFARSVATLAACTPAGSPC